MCTECYIIRKKDHWEGEGQWTEGKRTLRGQWRIDRVQNLTVAIWADEPQEQ